MTAVAAKYVCDIFPNTSVLLNNVCASLSQEECTELMLEILSDKELHERAAYGYKKVGQSVDFYCADDNLIVRD